MCILFYFNFSFFKEGGQFELRNLKTSKAKYQIILLIFELKGDTIENILSAFYLKAPPPFASGEQMNKRRLLFTLFWGM